MASLGAILDVNVNENKQMLSYAIEHANEKLLSEDEFKLASEVVEIMFGNEIDITRSICGLLEVCLHECVFIL